MGVTNPVAIGAAASAAMLEGEPYQGQLILAELSAERC
jgi:hypothetical protein